MQGQEITVFPVKHAGLVNPDKTLTKQGNWTDLCVVTSHLVVALRICIKFQSGNHPQLLRYGHTEIRR